MKLSQTLRRVGWWAFYLMWLPFAGIFIGMFSIPSGDYAWSELPLLARGSIVGTGFFFVVSMLCLVGAPLAGWLQSRSVLMNGQPAEAKILKVWDTGTTINNNPVVRMLLEVHPPGGVLFQAEAERLIPRLQVPQVQPGALVQVRYDPDSHAVALVSENQATQPTI
jgi:hypothetical protein